MRVLIVIADPIFNTPAAVLEQVPVPDNAVAAVRLLLLVSVPLIVRAVAADSVPSLR